MNERTEQGKKEMTRKDTYVSSVLFSVHDQRFFSLLLTIRDSNLDLMWHSFVPIAVSSAPSYVSLSCPVGTLNMNILDSCKAFHRCAYVNGSTSDHYGRNVYYTCYNDTDECPNANVNVYSAYHF